MKDSLTKRSIAKNISASFLMRLIYIIVTFMTRSIFIEILGVKILGLNAVFSNILSMLSLTEMGLNSAILYSLYSQLAKKDEEKMSAIIFFYRRLYRIIGGIILILGILVMPFLQYLKGIDEVGINSYLIYLLLLLNSVITYYLSYKTILLEADQRVYLVSIVKYSSLISMNFFQIILLKIYGNFYIYLILNIIFNVFSNLILISIVDKKYIFLKVNKKIKLNSADQKSILKNCSALFIHRVSGFIVFGTDNLLIAYFSTIRNVGLYDTYYLIINNSNIIIKEVLNALRSTIGNIVAISNKDSSYEIYKVINFACFFFYAFGTANLYILISPFITFWLGKQYVINENIIIIVLLNFYITGLRTVILMYKDANGLFTNDVVKAVLEALFNLIFSVLFAHKYGMLGVFIGTLLSTILTSFWFEPYLVFKLYFKVKLIEYWKDYFIKFGMLLLIILICKTIFQHIYDVTDFILASIANAAISLSLLVLLNIKRKEFQFILKKIKFIIGGLGYMLPRRQMEVKMKEKLVSIVLPIYNSEKYIKDSLESILNQTYKKLEIILINDCSTDRTKELIDGYKDNRIKIINNEANMGISRSLNKGISLAKGVYIARMDSDDICIPTRIKEQVNLLKNNPEIDICGSFVKTFGISNRISVYPITSEEIRINLMFGCSMAHPTIMFRRRIINDYIYSENSKVEDYKLWVDLSQKGFKLYNLPKPLLNYRVHEDSLSHIKADDEKKRKLVSDYITILKYANKCFIKRDLSDEEVAYLFLSPDMLLEKEINYDLLLPVFENYYNYCKKVIDPNELRICKEALSKKLYEKAVMMSLKGIFSVHLFRTASFNIYRNSAKKNLILLYLTFKNRFLKGK